MINARKNILSDFVVSAILLLVIFLGNVLDYSLNRDFYFGIKKKPNVKKKASLNED
jgi:hypothetical protein